MVILKDTTELFSKKLNRERIRVVSEVVEMPITNEYVNKIKEDKTLLCHVDQSACKDSAWVKVKAGTADTLPARSVNELRNKNEVSGKNYVKVLTIIVEDYKILE